MINFPFSILPRILKCSILDHLNDSEAYNLLQTNKESRYLSLKRGLFPKYIEEINFASQLSFWATDDSEPICLLNICLLYRRFDPSQIEPSSSKWPIAGKDFVKRSISDVNGPIQYGQMGHFAQSKLQWLDEKALWKQMNRIRFCKKIYFSSWFLDEISSIIEEKIRSKSFFAKLDFKVFYICSEIDMGKRVIENFRPKSLDELWLFGCSQEVTEEQIDEYHSMVLRKPTFRDCKVIYLDSLKLNHWKVTRELKCDHIGILSNFDQLLTTLRNYLDKGVPAQNRGTSLQIRATIGSGREMSEIDDEITQIIQLICEEMKFEDLDPIIVEAIEKLAYRTLYPYEYETFQSKFVADPTDYDFSREIHPLQKTRKVFSQKNRENEWIVAFSVENHGTFASPSYNVSIVWIPKDETEM